MLLKLDTEFVFHQIYTDSLLYKKTVHSNCINILNIYSELHLAFCIISRCSNSSSYRHRPYCGSHCAPIWHFTSQEVRHEKYFSIQYNKSSNSMNILFCYHSAYVKDRQLLKCNFILFYSKIQFLKLYYPHINVNI